MGLLNMMNIIKTLGLIMHRAHATERPCSDGTAVIRVLTADDEPLLRLTQQLVVAMNELYLSVICL